MTHALAISLGPAIRCNAILPGWIETAAFKKASQRKTPKHRRISWGLRWRAKCSARMASGKSRGVVIAALCHGWFGRRRRAPRRL